MSFDFAKFQQQGELMLLTLDDWYYGADGNQYKAIWGKVWVRRASEILGFEPKNTANFVYQVGDGANACFFMGCRVHYAVLCKESPKNSNVLIVREEN